MRPSTGGRPSVGGRPSASDLGGFLDLPKPGSGGGSGGGSRPGLNRPGGADRPSIATRPGSDGGSTFDNILNGGGAGNRPGNGNRPGGEGLRPGGDGNRPGWADGNLPGNGGDRPNRPDNGNRPDWADGNRPNRPDNGYRPGGDNRPNNGNRPDWAGGNRPGNGNYRPGDHFRPGFDNSHINNWGNNIRNDWSNHYHNNINFTNINNNFYRPGWGTNYPGYRNAYFNCRPPFAGGWWAGATVGVMTGWLVGGAGAWGQPVYYDYGSGGNVYYEGDTVYVNGQASASAADYAAQAQQLAVTGEEQLSQPLPEGEQMDWLPLGVFALSTSEDEKEPTRILQMALNKEGVINGTMYNSETKQSVPLVGAVDKATQRACWYAGDNKDIVAETGLYNLTKDQTSVLVHYGSDRTEEYLLVRLDAPAETSQTGAQQPSSTQQ